MKKTLVLGSLLSSLFVSHAFANTDTIKDALEKAFNIQVESIEKTSYGDLYEVVTADTILYTDNKGSFVIAGSLIDTQTLEDVTETRLKKLSAVDFQNLPLDKALKRVNGNGERKIVTFEDPNCGYCKRLYSELSTIDNATIYTFMVPILGKDSVKKVSNIWCAKDRNAAWAAWMQDHVKPEDVAACDEPTADVLAYARKIQLRGTPIVLLANGERLNGFAKADVIVKALSK